MERFLSLSCCLSAELTWLMCVAQSASLLYSGYVLCVDLMLAQCWVSVADDG